MKIVIIGGVAGGATAAARLRRLDEKAEIVLFEKGEHISYANCGLPYYIGGVIAARDSLFLQTPAGFATRFALQVHTRCEVIGIDRAAKTVRWRDLAEGSEGSESYDKLVLSPGALPVRPPLPGLDDPRVFTLRDVADTDRIRNFVDTASPRSMAVVGAGFIGLEMAENLHHRGITVHLVEMQNQVLPPMDFSMASLVHQELDSRGVRLRLSTALERIEASRDSLRLHFKGGESIDVDAAILSIGVRPNTKLAQEAGIKIGETGGIWVGPTLQTSDPDIYAVGDAVEFPHLLTGKPVLPYLAGPANRQARLAADNIVQDNRHAYKGPIGTAIAKVFDQTAAMTGLSAKALQRAGLPWQSVHIHGNSHAGYYPGAVQISLKLLFDPRDGRLWGAQAVGFDAADKRIDIIATLIGQGATIYDLAAIEHAYAPPFSSAKDPAAMAAYVAQNVLEGRQKIVHWRDIATLDPSRDLLLDVRTEAEFATGTLPGARNIPLDQLRDRLAELPAGKRLVVFCGVGLRGYLACQILEQHGMQAVNLSGGLRTWKACTTPIGQGQAFTASPTALQATERAAEQKPRVRIDACGLQCPGPILRLRQTLENSPAGTEVEVLATDPGFERDAQSWCRSTGNDYLGCEREKGTLKVVLRKGLPAPANLPGASAPRPLGKTLIVFSDDLDKALATFVLANGAAATGHKTTLFFTFWGLNVIKKTRKPPVRKDLVSKMFGFMMPSHSLALKLSKMHMLGMGTLMMRWVMKRKNVESLENLILQARAAGVEFIACQMSMDVMGVQREELLDWVQVGGVATYMERAENAAVNLFI